MSRLSRYYTIFRNLMTENYLDHRYGNTWRIAKNNKLEAGKTYLITCHNNGTATIRKDTDK